MFYILFFQKSDITVQWLKQETGQLKTKENPCLLRRSTLSYTILLWKQPVTKGLASGFCLKHTLPLTFFKGLNHN